MKKLLVLLLIINCQLFIDNSANAQSLSVSTSVTANVSCHGGNNGSILASPTGGTSPYIYTWIPSTGATTQTASNLTARTYTVSVTDHHGMTATASSIVTQPAAIRDSAAFVIEPTCNGGANGIIGIGAKGGIAPYTYTWTSSVSTLSAATGLSAGTYTISIEDNNGCNSSLTCTLTQPLAIRDSIVTASTVNVSPCYGGSNGSATVGGKYGTLPYRYIWSPNINVTDKATGLTAGTYSIVIADSNGCSSSTATITITQPAATFTPTVSSMTYPSCGGGTGSSTISVSGTSSPYTYLWSPTSKTTATATGLSAGNYIVTISCSSGCSSKLAVDITQPAPLIASASAYYSSVCSGGGSDTLFCKIISGGTSPYTYSWSPTTGLSCSTCQKPIATLSTSKTYTVTVTDHNGCTGTASVSIDANITCNGSVCSSPISFLSDITDSLPSDTAKWYTFTDTAKNFDILVKDLSGSIGQIHSLKLYTSCGGHLLSQVSIYNSNMDTIYISHDTNTNASITYYLHLSDNVSSCFSCAAGKVKYIIKRIGYLDPPNNSCIYYSVTPNPANSYEEMGPENYSSSGCICYPNDSNCGEAPGGGAICAGDSVVFSEATTITPFYFTVSRDTVIGRVDSSVVVFRSSTITGYKFTIPGMYNVDFTQDSILSYAPTCPEAQLTVESPPNPTFNISPNPACIGNLVELTKTDRVSLDSADWNWSPGGARGQDTLSFMPCEAFNAMPGNIDTVTLTEDFGGTLTFELPSSDATIQGCVVKTPKALTVDSLDPSFTYTNTTCGGGVTEFTNTSTCPSIRNPDYTWTWYFGDGDTSTGIEASHIYSSSSTYTVTLTAYNGICGGTSIIQPVTVSYSNPDPPINNGEASNGNNAIDLSVYTGSYYVSGPVYTFQNINSYNGFDGLNIEGTFTVDANCEFQGDDIYMGSNALIDIKSPYTLTIYYSHLQCCGNMWRGIVIEPGANLIIKEGTLIEDADTAIHCKGGGEYQVEQSTLNRNYVGIEVDTTTSAVTGTIKTTQISCNLTPSGVPPYNFTYTVALGGGTTLNAPYSSQMSYAGIALNNVDGIQIGYTASGDTNTFEYQYYGIYSIGSSFSVYNNVFENIDYNNPSYFKYYGIAGAGIFASPSSTNNCTINIGGHANTQSNSFQNFNYGVFINGAGANYYNYQPVYLNIGNGTFTGGSHGVAIENSPTYSKLNVGFSGYANTFNSIAGIGIYSYNNPYSNLQLNWNSISAITGISVVEPTLLPKNSVNISENTITAKTGIFGQNFKGVVKSNKMNIVFGGCPCTIPNIVDGVYMEPGAYTNVYNNTITCAQTNWGDGIVMQSPGCLNNLITCNTITSGVNSTAFLGNNSQDTYFDYNQMDNYTNAGMFFSSTGDIGQQGSPGAGTNNEWNSTNACGTGVPYATYSQSTFPASFYVTASSCGAEYPSNNQNNGAVNIHSVGFNSGAGTDCYVCSGSGTPPCGGGGNNNQNITVSIAEAIAATGFGSTSGTYATATLWDKKHDLFLSLKSYDSTFLDSSTAIRQFYDSIETSNMGKLYSIATLLSDSSGVSSTDIGSAESDYASITSPDTSESTARNVYTIMLQMASVHQAYADSLQAVSLRSIAQLCPYQYGYGVYIARALLSPIDTVLYTSACEVDTNSSGEQMHAPKPKPKSNLFANVYPNPASTMLNIKIKALSDTSQMSKEINYFYLFNELGALVKRTELKSSFTTIPLTQLAAGIYYYRIVDEEQNPIRMDKLLIIR